MSTHPQLIVMLTLNDYTVANAAEVFEHCRDSRALIWGMKEHSLPLEEMKRLYAKMKSCGKTTALEVAAYSEAEGLRGAAIAAECGCDILMGTCYTDAIRDYCREHHLKYMPFVGQISGRPSVLEGSIDSMIAEAKRYLEKGAYGIDLLGYRYVGDAAELNRRFVAEVPAPVCLAGSIDSFERLDEVKTAAPWAFTIGTAFFEHQFGSDFAEQIDRVYEYMSR